MEEVKDWLAKAEADLRAARINLKEGLYEESAFFFQQVAEKALKALYISGYGKLLKVHDLLLLAKKIGAPKEICGISDNLSQHYVATRYPTDAEYTESDAEEAVEQATKVVEWAKRKL